MQTNRPRLLAVAAAAALAITGASALAGTPTASAKGAPAKDTTVHLLAFNDFHGNIDPPSGSGGLVNGVPAGGVEYLAHAVKAQRATDKTKTPYVYTVAAGDIVGGSPLVSAAFHDEPAVEEMNSLGLDVTSVGNHEFDEGVTELKRLQNGGCHPVDGCQDGDGFAGANYPMLAANVVDKVTGQPILAPYVIKKVGNAKIAFIGETLEGTPSIVNPAGIQTVNFLDEADTANKYAKLLRKTEGVKAFVLLLHEGGQQNPPPAAADPNGCANFSGAVTDIVKRLDPAFGIVISGHTHRSYVCNLPNSSGKNSLVTSAGSAGTLLTDVTFTLGHTSKQFVSASAVNSIVENGIKNPDGTYQKDASGVFVKNPALVDGPAKVIADKYRTAVAPLANQVVGGITADITNASNAAGESALGDVIADGMLARTQSAGAQIGLMNPGGIRASLSYAFSPGGEAPGQVTYGEAFSVQPFNNLVVTVSITGAQLKEVLEQQFTGYAGQGSTKFLQVSAGFTYSYDTTRALGDRISNMQLNGVPMDPAATYRVSTNDFVANGGDGFTNFGPSTNRVYAPGFDVDALTAYLATGPIAPGPMNRITKIA
ncbi:bifunctional metallophosphatase/5'-nucleotidase [Nocardioides marmorisolisilvae]|uniref:Bifunctional metallophosphatase/5'-nucleotidase n=1 Tax=Nocardioides marmorisolisilvae TaxID=1542737 RepID=A0A3N0DS82_9ACTN|nr:bifunctional metallophosphatase/5'-nucleotidase [Nocardioides marmorisolisilvae]RNL78492.1 bifunctional metallophosphatase/5'-nucleotidase [Nocardioides marmorisolisilvae]